MLGREVLPRLAAAAGREGRPLRAWSAGAASGEEPYTLALIAVAPRTPIELVASERDPLLIARAKAGRYPASSLRELPAPLRALGFVRRDEDLFELRPETRRAVTFVHQDVREPQPAGPFDLVLCRNVAFMYFDDAGRRAMLARIAERLVRGGLLVVGSHDRLPADADAFVPLSASPRILRRGDRS